VRCGACDKLFSEFSGVTSWKRLLWLFCPVGVSAKLQSKTASTITPMILVQGR